MFNHSAHLTKTLVLNAGEGPVLQMMGGTITQKVAGADNGGGWTLLELTMPPHFPGPPLHWHAHMTEAFYVLDGELAFTLEQETRIARRGCFTCIPPGVLHTFRNPTAAPVTLLEWGLPHGLWEYFEALATMLAAEPVWPPADLERLWEMEARYDTLPASARDALARS